MRDKKEQVYKDTVELIVFHMKTRGYDQRTLAKKASLLETTISRAIYSKRGPNLYVLTALCRALDITPNDLLGFSGPKLPLEAEIIKLKDKMFKIERIINPF